MITGLIAGIVLVFLLLGYLVYALINAEAFLMAAQAFFLLIASFLVVLFVLARPLGSGLARLINNVPLPGTKR